MLALQRLSICILLLVGLAHCASLPTEVVHQTDATARPQSADSLLANIAANYKPTNTGTDSAVLLQETGWDALAQRLALVEVAEHSIDIQYYIWHSDKSGQYLASRLLAAAERGVNVRVMLDDINLNEREGLLVALDSHPNITIRVFNPIPTRSGVAKWLNVLGDFDRLNRRMHNKSFTVDGVISIVGGRNIGDEYFDLSDEINFRDRDVMVMGTVIKDIQSSYHSYWNSRWSYPVELLGGDPNTQLPSHISKPNYQHSPALPTTQAQASQMLGQWLANVNWVQARFISDQPVPADVENTDQPKATAVALAELMLQSQQRILIESAYLVFDDKQLQRFQGLTQKGIEVKAFTNSMVSNDLVTNHSGYAGRRHDMLAHGMQLFELKPDSPLCLESTKDATKCAPHAAYGLHAKSIVFDDHISAIGSFNFNLRSTYLNTESLLIIKSPTVAAKLRDTQQQAMTPENSWRLALEHNEVRWYSGQQQWQQEPETGQWQRLQSKFLQLLPIEKYL
ncbi:phospholipase D family protein [Motilimonas pumila]|uniref:Phospholipase D family protein n=1 Tax=Motilimonas pumila TaxID=2303987 RepID=A0A418YI90_9GAMM|nr:phospholipase D family protein [Motilimonas pumila]RJG50065.1 phospholipase D family protein [Motilimonas pumila]